MHCLCPMCVNQDGRKISAVSFAFVSELTQSEKQSPLVGNCHSWTEAAKKDQNYKPSTDKRLRVISQHGVSWTAEIKGVKDWAYGCHMK